MPAKAKADDEFRNKTVHHLLSQDILADAEVASVGIPLEYAPIDLTDDFVLQKVIPVFENYSFADASIDAIGAVFEALARRAEKDNRIGQFFTPETAVAATCRLAGLRPTDLIADPACGTGRFLIRAMADMLANADKVPGKNRDQAESNIKRNQILGCDIDPWISVIAKMNMYIHGDGKSNIRHANGLSLAAKPTFAPSIPTPVVDLLDVVVTNPPLGDIDFMAVADTVARDLADVKGTTPTDAELSRAAAEWSKGVFDVVPHEIQETQQRDRAKKKALEWLEKATVAKAEGDTLAEGRARTKYDEWDKKRETAEKAIGSGEVTYVPAGRTAKGGALFISALVQSLKPVRDAALPLEWRGGVLALVIDEAVLNTQNYATARSFIRRNFFLKAVVSLPRDAFADLAKTTAKTSILLLVRKEDIAVVQREPVFFARAVTTGAAGRDITRANDLLPICDAFDRWRSAVLAECGGGGGVLPEARVDHCSMAMRSGLPAGVQLDVRALDAKNAIERLDEAYWCMKDLVRRMPAHVPLSDVVDLVTTGRTPVEKDIYPFAYASRIDVRVRPKGSMATEYSANALRTLQEGDILVSGIDLVHGGVGVVGADCKDMIVSKEFYILRAKEGVDAHWVVALLRTPAMRRIVEGTCTGTSNRTRVESADVLMGLPIPPAPDEATQKAIGDHLRNAHLRQKEMEAGIAMAETQAAEKAGLAVMKPILEGVAEEAA
nr:N-6 DNA methylase [Methylorubrum extorquens]